MGFRAVARHRSKDVTLYRQNDVNFIVNAEPDCHGARFARAHGPSACAMAFRVKDAGKAHAMALEKGAKSFQGKVGPMELNIPAIEGIGGSVIYFVDRYAPGSVSIYDIDFVATDPSRGFRHDGAGLIDIDHVTHNVYRGNMNVWAGFYEKLFNFREVKYFDIEGKLTGLKSRAMTSPCGRIRIPINESSDDKSQIAEYLDEYKGEGIQHIALSSADIYRSVEQLRGLGVNFQSTIETYFEGIDARVPDHGEDLVRLKRNHILIDGGPDSGLLLQIFTQNAIGPIFFEIIQRKGNQGFGEGNFKALFESIELDQIRRGVLSA
jgi:4-hydroxyphenylpyruvate dioxygenase